MVRSLMAKRLLLYGATGYTARLILDSLLAAGLRPILAARDVAKLKELAKRHDLDWRASSVDDPDALDLALADVDVVLNVAGPFSQTADPLVLACLRAGAHYLDISGEATSIDLVSRHHRTAVERGVMLMPAVGFDVVPSDCLCKHVTELASDVHALRIAISGLELISPGSAKTLSAELGRPTRVRRNGELAMVPPAELNWTFDFGAGPRLCTAVTWGDLATAHYTTGAPNVETYFEMTPSVAAVAQMNRAFGWLYRMPFVQLGIERQSRLWQSTPTAEQRASRRAAIVVEAEQTDGTVVRARMQTPEAYTMTAATATAIAARVLSGDVEPGFQTAGRLFGANFIMKFDGVTRQDL